MVIGKGKGKDIALLWMVVVIGSCMFVGGRRDAVAVAVVVIIVAGTTVLLLLLLIRATVFNSQLGGDGILRHSAPPILVHGPATGRDSPDPALDVSVRYW